MKSELMEAVRRVADETPGRLGCHICDAAGNVWASHRADERFSTASVIKVPILVALAESVDAGEHRWDEVVLVNADDPAAGSGVIQYLSRREYSLHDVAMLMIIVSDNRATNLVIDLLGLDRINEYCRQAGWPGTILGRRMYDFEARARGRDNVSTPRETADLLVRLLNGTLLSSAATETALEILRAQQSHDQLPAWLPPDAAAAHKTGELPGVQNDSGILFLPSGPVIAAVYTNDLLAPAWGRLAIQRVGRAVVENASGTA
ncbi:MAG TPA: serine hydrolase [bacterium]|nr:serine hydrolase [bacterium]